MTDVLDFYRIDGRSPLTLRVALPAGCPEDGDDRAADRVPQ